MSARGSIRRVALVEPPYVFWDRSMDRLRQSEESIPGFGMLMLAAVARARGYEVRIFDAKGSGESPDRIATGLLAFAPDVVGFSATTVSIANADRIAQRVKAAAPQTITVVGGAHVSAVPERTLAAFPALDYGMIGEGELSFFEFLARLGDGGGVGDCAGLVHRRGEEVVANRRAPYITDLDALPRPAWDLVRGFPHRFHPSLLSYRRSPVATLVTSRGCPFSCSFCDRSTSGKLGRYHSTESVLRHCRHLVDLGVRHIIFYDDLFTVKRQRVVEICEGFLAAGLDFTWSCNSHPNLLDFETLRLMKRAGCWQIAYGIESGSQRILDVVKREVRLPRMRETLRMTRAAGIRAKGYLMIGHPTETFETLEETAEFLRVVELDLCQITKFTPYPGTPAYPTIRAHGAFTEDWERMNAMNFVFVPSGLSEAALETQFHRLYSIFYSRLDVLRGIARMVLEEPRFLRQLGSSAWVYLKSQLPNRHFRRGILGRRCPTESLAS
ncbi:MAG: cobalamin B12-binding domain-containing protein [Deltaproteobacteria bacterium]|nr:cobalamin B12-binding domain-containing protein [Deltaproteobacteria bacterium]